MKRPKFFIFYPFLLAIYPILYLYIHNIGQLMFSDFLFFVALNIVLTLILYFLSKLFIKNEHRAAFVTGVIIFLFFSYGAIFPVIAGWKIAIYSDIENQWVIDWVFGRHRYLMGLFVVITFIGFIWAKFKKPKLDKLTKILNFTTILLIIFSIIPLFSYLNKQKGVKSDANKDIADHPAGELQLSYKPDIYYIVLDGHTREDIFKEFFNYDNSKFTNDLSLRNFYIASKSYANYSRTYTSLPSSLNMRYLDELPETYGVDWPYINATFPLMAKNKVQLFLKNQGYKTIAFESGYGGTDCMQEDVDIFYSKKELISGFANEVINLTPFGFFIKDVPSISPYGVHRSRIEYTLNGLKDIPDIKEPTFTFAHIIAPHQPFVFAKEGQKIVQTQLFNLDSNSVDYDIGYIQKYTEQAVYLDRLILKTVDAILEKSKDPPIIILQGDHGPKGEPVPNITPVETKKIRQAILNTYYLPSFDYTSLSPEISPVNSFRHIFNYYFGTDYQILENKYYRVNYENSAKFDFEDITKSLDDLD